MARQGPPKQSVDGQVQLNIGGEAANKRAAKFGSCYF